MPKKRKKKYNIRETSLLAYSKVLETLGERQRRVYSALRKLKKASNTMIAKEVKLPINCVVPRIHELRKLGVVRQEGKHICNITNKQVLFWKVFWQI